MSEKSKASARERIREQRKTGRIHSSQKRLAVENRLAERIRPQPVTDRRSLVGRLMGDPPAGRSELDKRQKQ